ncbi:hypothetical protein BT96DRAFT_647046 [Gymnopus androsaceus JB14]|uniref:Uncharacterized protein n=1 Tax=Gymnopus androsaceus JB14 TaxID=1447944 RepID=A0A6A4HPT4_9AGAR|nr:hypothetical protein BT96DRAFT_647046 [Gymnopus androsaceus JB14]
MHHSCKETISGPHFVCFSSIWILPQADSAIPSYLPPTFRIFFLFFFPFYFILIFSDIFWLTLLAKGFRGLKPKGGILLYPCYHHRSFPTLTADFRSFAIDQSTFQCNYCYIPTIITARCRRPTLAADHRHLPPISDQSPSIDQHIDLIAALYLRKHPYHV